MKVRIDTGAGTFALEVDGDDRRFLSPLNRKNRPIRPTATAVS